MKITEEKDANIAVLNIEGRIDGITSVELEKTMTALIDQGERKIVLDFTNVDYVSSAGLRIFFAYLQKLKILNGTLYFSSLSERIENLFDTVGFLTICKIFKNKFYAIEDLKKSL